MSQCLAPSLYVVLFLIAGIAAGFVLRRRERFLKTVDRLTTWFIYLFLFMLGLSVGINPEIVRNFGTLGFKAIAISAAAVIGSLIPAYFLHRLWIRKDHDEE
jgi:uncharacterized membrane protein YbjE (DUF340 family)